MFDLKDRKRKCQWIAYDKLFPKEKKNVYLIFTPLNITRPCLGQSFEGVISPTSISDFDDIISFSINCFFSPERGASGRVLANSLMRSTKH